MDERTSRAKNMADRLIEEFYDSTAEKDWPMWATDAVTAMERYAAALSQPAAAGVGDAAPKEYSWECNECGAQEYTMCVSEADVRQLGCGSCGGDEWHKAISRATP